MKPSLFVIRRFKNRNGVHSFRVTGHLNGVRIRRNFKSQEEAATEKAHLELKGLQLASNLHAVATILTDAQVREAEAVFRRLAGDTRSLSFCVDYTITPRREPTAQLSLASAVTEYLASKTHEQSQGIIAACQLGSIRRQLVVFQRHFPTATVAALSPAQLTAYCQHGNASLKTYNNRRGILSTSLKFAFQRDWIASNLIERVAYHRIAHRRGSATTFSAKQAQELMSIVEGYQNGCLVPFFALCLFAGIRPCMTTGEICKLKPEHVRLDIGVIHIEPEVSKVRMKRHVTIQPNLAAWLRAYPLEKYPIILPNMPNHRAKIAKLFSLSHDIMRHTFISMFVAKFRSMGEAALQAGNSEGIIRKHYLDLKNPSEAEQFFAIVPKNPKAVSPVCDAAVATQAPPQPVAA